MTESMGLEKWHRKSVNFSMKIKRLKLQNFLSHESTEVLLQDIGVTLLDGVNGSGKCLSAGSKVLDFDSGRLVTIEDFVEREVPRTVGFVGGRCVPVNVTEWHRLGKKEILEVKLRGGTRIRCAPTHPVMTPGGFVQCGSLRVGDYVAETRRVPSAAVESPSNDEAFLLGLMLGDGAMTESGVSFSKKEDGDTEVLAWFRLAVERLFGGEITSYNGGRVWTVTGGNRLARSRFRLFLEDWDVFGKTSREKEFPRGALGWSDEALGYLLGGLWTTDGYVHSDPTTREVSYCTSSEALSDDVRWALRRLGIVSSVRVRVVAGVNYWNISVPVSSYGRFNESVRLVGKKAVKMTAQTNTLGIRENHNVDCIPPYFCEKLASPGRVGKGRDGSRRSYKQLQKHAMSRTTYLNFGGDPKVASADYFWTTVQSIIPVGVEECFDITVDTEEHSYVANGVVVHNSSIANGLYWGLFGETLNDLPVDSISHQGQGNTLVEVDVVVRGVEIQIRRFLKHSVQKSNLFVTANGERISGGTNRETQYKLNGLLGVDALAFRWTCVFHPSEKGFASLSDKDQKSVLETILRTDRFTEAQERAKDQLRDLETKHETAKALIRTNVAQIDNYNRTISDLKKKQTTWADDRLAAEQKAQKALAKHQEKMPESLEARRQGYAELFEAAKQVTQDLPVNIGKQRALHAKLLETRASVSRFQTSAQHLERERFAIPVIQVEKLLAEASNCPSCKQTLPPQALEQLKAEFLHRQAENLQKKADLNSQIKEYQAKAEQATKEMADTEAAIEMVDNAVAAGEKVQALATGAKGQLALLEREWASWRTTDEVLRSQLARIQEETNPYGDLILGQQVLLKEAEDAISLAQGNILDLESRIKVVRFWVDGFGRQGVISLLLDSVVPVLNERAAYYLSILSHKASVEFQTQTTTAKGQVREKFTVTAKYQWGAASYQGTSDGERRRVDLAVLFALADLLESRNGTPINIRILDEPFGPLDEVGREQTMKLLKQLSKRVGTILCTSHEETLKALPDWDTRFSVVNEQGVSKVSNG